MSLATVKRWRCPRCGRAKTSGHSPIRRRCYYDGASMEPCSSVPMLAREERERVAIMAELCGWQRVDIELTTAVPYGAQTIEDVARDYLALTGNRAVDAGLLAAVISSEWGLRRRSATRSDLLACERGILVGEPVEPWDLSAWADWAARTGPR